MMIPSPVPVPPNKELPAIITSNESYAKKLGAGAQDRSTALALYCASNKSPYASGDIEMVNLTVPL